VNLRGFHLFNLNPNLVFKTYSESTFQFKEKKIEKKPCIFTMPDLMVSVYFLHYADRGIPRKT